MHYFKTLSVLLAAFVILLPARAEQKILTITYPAGVLPPAIPGAKRTYLYPVTQKPAPQSVTVAVPQSQLQTDTVSTSASSVGSNSSGSTSTIQEQELELPKAPLEPTHGEWGLTAFYAQSSGFWSSVDQLKNTKTMSPSELNSLINDSYQKPLEGIAQLKWDYRSTLRSGTAFSGIYDQSIFKIAAVEIGGGKIENRQIPNVKGYSVTALETEFLLRDSYKRDRPGFSTRFGTVTGGGRVKTIQADIGDTSGEIPTHNSTLLYGGLTLGLDYRSVLSDKTRSNFELEFRPTYFYSARSRSEDPLAESKGFYTHRIRGVSEFMFESDIGISDYLEWGVVGMIGPQPIPDEILPRTWDYIHPMHQATNILANLGGGGRIRFGSDDLRSMVTLTGGVFAGLPGGSARVKLGWFFAEVGSYGIELSRGFQIESNRMNYGSLGVYSVF